ncbi:hypothetical protein D3C75_566900 [compost metagenome]
MPYTFTCSTLCVMADTAKPVAGWPVHLICRGIDFTGSVIGTSTSSTGGLMVPLTSLPALS